MDLKVSYMGILYYFFIAFVKSFKSGPILNEHIYYMHCFLLERVCAHTHTYIYICMWNDL
jgi:hypothetical protein